LPKALFGLMEQNAWGKLSATWYKGSIIDELNVLDFDMSRPPGRTYRYYTGEPVFPFGFGLNPLTKFELSDMRLSSSCPSDSTCGNVTISATVSNVGKRPGDEVLLAYFVPQDIPKSAPAFRLRQQLFGFERVHIQSGESRSASFDVTTKTLQLYDEAGFPKVYEGRYLLQISNGIDSVQELVSVRGNGLVTEAPKQDDERKFASG
jgi:beta-glucosidase